MTPSSPPETVGGPTIDPPTLCPKPYHDLFIYYLKGRVQDNPFLNIDDFIGNWEEEQDTFLFFHAPADSYVAALLDRQPHLQLQDCYEMTYDDWQGGAPAPFTVGRLQVVPPWDPAAATPSPMTLLLDPGVVFGTGTHPTTHDCLTALHAAFDRRPVTRVLDIGTGTGLLALAAAKMGAHAVVAVDLNHLAAATARRNVQYNRMTHRILVVRADALNFMDPPSDLMISNIHYAVMRRMIAAPGFIGHSQFILSGLLRSQAREIEYQLQRLPIRILGKWERDATWFTYYGETDARDETG
ncbi:MAG: 50S ribosomal protein L11 methyltransferase [Desulfatitalea sp.]|nr:50S ribosomal protein L11 methyltransferase [Desulfatitalea sp.]